MATHSSTLAWKIPWMEEAGRLQSMGSLGVGHDWATSLSLFTFIHWRRKWQPTPVFLPGESQGPGSLLGCPLWGRRESDTTEWLHDFTNLYKWNYLYGNLPFYKIQVNHFMALDESSGAEIIPKYILSMRALVPFWVLRHSFLSLTDCQWLYNIQLKTSRGILFLPPSDAYDRSFLYLLYTLIKLYYTKALSDQASSLAPDLILLLQRPRIPGSFRGSATTFQ